MVFSVPGPGALMREGGGSRSGRQGSGYQVYSERNSADIPTRCCNIDVCGYNNSMCWCLTSLFALKKTRVSS